MKNENALDDLLGYREARRPYLPDYAARRAARLWIARNRVEKFNSNGTYLAQIGGTVGKCLSALAN